MPKSKVVLPQKQALLDAMQVAETSIEAASYLVTEFRSLLTKAKLLETYADLMHKVQDWGEHVAFKLLSSAQPWLGQPVQTDYLNAKINRAEKAVKDLKDMKTGLEEDLSFHFAIGDSSEFRRGYSSGTKAVDAPSVSALDNIYMAWLAENKLGTEQGVVYRTDAKGNFQMNGANKVKADPEVVKKLVVDPEYGLAKYAQNRGIDLKCVQHPYLSPKAEAQAKASAQQAVTQLANETPGSGIGGGTR